jgi:hypothetical protein
MGVDVDGDELVEIHRAEGTPFGVRLGA